NEPPVPAYTAKVVQANELLDLAILRISAGLDGSDIDTGALNLPFVPIGDPSIVLPGTTLTFSGFPEPGSISPIAISGTISGLNREEGGTRSAWFRTTATLGGVMSRGRAFNNKCELIGALTSASRTD